jgi:hypothetical protein
MPHVFHVFGWLPEAKLALQQVAAYIIENAETSPRPASRLS